MDEPPASPAETARRRSLRRGPTPHQPPRTDETDLAILAALVADGRMSNVALAERVGIAETTCSGRVRALRERGVLTGVHARVDLARLGLPVEAIVAVRLAGHDREMVMRFGTDVAQLPHVLAVYNVSGADDYLVHVVAPDTEALRDFVLDNISARTGVNHVETALVFSGMPGRRPLG